MENNLQKEFGNIDIYLFDQILKGRFDNCNTILDAGCGFGRNIIYFLRNGFNVYGVDTSTEAIDYMIQVSKEISPLNQSNFSIQSIENLSFDSNFFDLVICNAVLHFAGSEEHFFSMLQSIWRVIKPGGYFFARLASDIGIEDLVIATGNGRYILPDGSERFLVNQEKLLKFSNQLNATFIEPIKTTNVQNLRCMTTWCLQKTAS
jgi:SAM-dependent methyltransferase